MKVSVVLACILLLTSNLEARQSRPPIFLTCEVLSESGGFPGDLTLELRALAQNRPPDRIPVMLDGKFECRNLEVGDYEVRIYDGRGAFIQDDSLSIHEGGGLVSVRLRRPPKEVMQSGTGVISVQKLMHPVPSKAEKEFRRSNEASSAGDLRKSMEHLQKALHIYPDYMEAHNNLGVSYMGLQRFDRAIDEFRKAVALGPSSDKTHLNLGLALLAIGQHDEAEAAVRKALSLAPRSIAAHYALGQVLYGQGKTTQEALENLQMSVEQFPLARLLAAQILFAHGAIPEAINQLQRYMDSGLQERREEVKALLGMMKARTVLP